MVAEFVIYNAFAKGVTDTACYYILESFIFRKKVNTYPTFVKKSGAGARHKVGARHVAGDRHKVRARHVVGDSHGTEARHVTGASHGAE